MNMKDKFFSAINDFGMLTEGDSVTVGASGGADSMCLLDMLYSYRDELGITITAAHINHCLRGAESDRDEAFVRDYCRERDIILRVLKADINTLSRENKESTELCARKVRYDFFASLNDSKIATAHTGSDAAETLLMNLSRGASLNGLCSIPPVRENIIRPLIYFTRKDTERYCVEHGIDYVTDSTNLSDDYTRNKIRHTIVTGFSDMNPAFEKNVMRCIASLREDNDFLESYSRTVFDECGGNSDFLDLNALGVFHKAIRFRVLADFFNRASGADFEKKHIELIDDHIGSYSYAVVLPGCQKAVIHDGKLFFEKKELFRNEEEISFDKNEEGCFSFYDYRITVRCGAPCKLVDGEIAVDFFKINDIITIRSRREGDSLRPLSRHCTKSLKKLFNEMKIPVGERASIPVISDSEGVIWCAVGGLDEKRCINDKTQKYLIIKTECGKNVR